MGTMIGKICFIYYKHIISGVVKNKEYFLENVTNLGLPLPLMKPDFPTLTSPMFMVAGDWSTPTAAIAALQLKADGTLSWVSSHGHTEPLTYMGFIAYILFCFFSLDFISLHFCKLRNFFINLISHMVFSLLALNILSILVKKNFTYLFI